MSVTVRYIQTAGAVSLHREGCRAATREEQDGWNAKTITADTLAGAVSMAEEGPDNSIYPVMVHGCLRKAAR